MGGSDHETRLRSSAHTSIGQVRENNEDNVRLWADDEFVVAVVADGMGGAVAGEEASRIAVEAIHQGKFFDHSADPQSDFSDAQIIDWLNDTIRAANMDIVHRASSNPELRGMGTTMTLAFVRRSRAIIAHVGDSRAYLIDGRSGRISQITADHSFVEALVAAGHLTHEQAEEHPMRNVLYRALGQNDDVDVDVYEVRLHAGDRLVLCSDGLTRHVKPGEIAAAATNGSDPDLATQSLIDLANARGGEDNVSVIMIMLDGQRPDDDTAELKDILTLDDSEILLKEKRKTDTFDVVTADEDDDTLRMKRGDVTFRANAADSDGHDTLTPEQ